MRGIKYFGVALVATVALGSATAAGASAATFKASKTGAIKAKQVTGQTFVTAAGYIECSTLSGTGTVSALEDATQDATVTFSGCSAFGYKATITNVEFEFNANGTASILKTVTIKVSGLCTITVPAQSDLSSVTYIDKSGKLEVRPAIAGITSSGSGAACEYPTESYGDYSGRSEVELVSGGTLEWL